MGVMRMMGRMMRVMKATAPTATKERGRRHGDRGGGGSSSLAFRRAVVTTPSSSIAGPVDYLAVAGRRKAGSMMVPLSWTMFFHRNRTSSLSRPCHQRLTFNKDIQERASDWIGRNLSGRGPIPNADRLVRRFLRVAFQMLQKDGRGICDKGGFVGS